MTSVRVFLSSPGDLVDERGIALAVIDELRYEPEIARSIDLEAIAWDDLGSGKPVFATETPQDSLNRGKRRPADCDVVVVMFWARFGTALPHPQYQKPDGSPYLSGTEWEYHDAIAGHSARGRPLVLLYRRQPMRGLDATSPTLDEDLAQQRTVLSFFASQVDDTGALLAGINDYSTPENFRQRFRRDLRFAIAQLDGALAPEPGDRSNPAVWQGSPFPGLRPFTPDDAPIFFGRGRSVDAVIERMGSSRFVAIVGSSGSGKSSLVGAGLIPRLSKLALPGVDRWILPSFDSRAGVWSGLRITPGGSGGDPFAGLARRLAPVTGRAEHDLVDELRRTPGSLGRMLEDVVGPGAGHGEALLFIDQFEELFTQVSQSDLALFLRLLASVATSQHARVIVTLRSDFFPRCVEEPVLADLLGQGQVTLSRPAETLSEMIERPALRAGLRFEEGLVDRVLQDAGSELASLPLLAYTLDELYRARGPSGELTHAAYSSIGGLHGAIGTRADLVFGGLDEPARSLFRPVFRQLVDVDESRRVTRRRAPLETVAAGGPARRLVDAFTSAGLLVTESGSSAEAQPVVFVAHEALFESWPLLRTWIEEALDDLAQVRSAAGAADQWQRQGRPAGYRWPHERMVPVLDAIKRLEFDLDPSTAAFLQPEPARLAEQLGDARLPAHQRRAVADRLAAIGADSLPVLAAALDDRDSTSRSIASSAIARIGADARPYLEHVIGHGSTNAALAAISAAVELGDEALAPSIAQILDHDERHVRSFARGALRKIGGPDAAAALSVDLVAGRFDDAWESAGALAALGSAGVAALVRSLTESDGAERASIQRAVKAAGHGLVDPAVDLLASHDPTTRLGAARLLMSIGGPAIDPLGPLTTHADQDVAELAVTVLGEIGDPSALDAIVRAAGDDRIMVRRGAARALVMSADASAIPTLVELLQDDDNIVRRTAGAALAELGSAIEGALDELLAVPASDGSRLRTVANVALVGSAAAAPLMRRAMVESDNSVRRRLVGALTELGLDGIPHLAQLVAHAPAAGADDAAVALASLGDRSASALGLLADTDDLDVRTRAIRGLGPTLDANVMPLVAAALRDPDPELRMSAADRLGRSGEDALATLIGAIVDSRPEVREAASVGLVTIGGLAAPGLLGLLSDPGVDRDLIVRTLYEIRTPTALFGAAAEENRQAGQ
jgi:HEAT repeat protein